MGTGDWEIQLVKERESRVPGWRKICAKCGMKTGKQV